MQQRVHSRVVLRTLLKLRRRAEGWFAREWSCWKPGSKTHDRIASGRPPTIPRTLYNTTFGRTVAPRDLMSFLISLRRAAGELHGLDRTLCGYVANTNRREQWTFLEKWSPNT